LAGRPNHDEDETQGRPWWPPDPTLRFNAKQKTRRGSRPGTLREFQFRE
jgi:hypothetical protein